MLLLHKPQIFLKVRDSANTFPFSAYKRTTPNLTPCEKLCVCEKVWPQAGPSNTRDRLQTYPRGGPAPPTSLAGRAAPDLGWKRRPAEGRRPLPAAPPCALATFRRKKDMATGSGRRGRRGRPGPHQRPGPDFRSGQPAPAGRDALPSGWLLQLPDAREALTAPLPVRALVLRRGFTEAARPLPCWRFSLSVLGSGPSSASPPAGRGGILRHSGPCAALLFRMVRGGPGVALTCSRPAPVLQIGTLADSGCRLGPRTGSRHHLSPRLRPWRRCVALLQDAISSERTAT